MSRKYLFPDSTFHKTGQSAFFGNDSELGISYEGGKAYVRARGVTEFYHGSTKVLELTSGGIKVTGTIYVNGEEFVIPEGGTGEMVYPTAGIALSTGSAWGTSIVNNSANWNTAYGWGNHAGLYEPAITKGTAGFLKWSGTGWVWDGNEYSLSNHDHSGVYAEAEHDHAGVYAVVGHDHDGVYAPIGAYEPALENPISDGYVLSSTALGSRSWISPANWDAAYGWGNHAGLYQVVNVDLTDILGLTGSGLLRRVGDGDWSLDGNAYALDNHDHDGVYAIEEHDHSGVYSVVGHDHDGEYAPIGAYEPALEDPISDGLFLTSTTAGVRSWTTVTASVADGDKGDITVASSGSSWTIDAAAVTYSKIQNVAADRFLANISGVAGSVGEVATNRIPLFSSAITGTPSSSTYLRGDGAWVTPTVAVSDGDKGDITVSSSGATWTIDDQAVSYAKIQNVQANSFLANVTGSAASVSAVDTTRIPLFSSAITGTPGSTTYLRGDGTWATPTASATLTYSENILTAGDVTIAVANTWYTGATLTLAAGTYFLVGTITVVRTTTTATIYSARITDSTVTLQIASGGDYRASVANNITSITLTGVVVLTGSTTINLQATANQTAVIKRILLTNTFGNTATKLVAVKIA